MLNDKHIEDLSYEIDEFLLKCSNKYSVGALSLSAITLARVIRLADEFGSREELDLILMTAMQSHKDTTKKVYQ